MLLIGQGGAIDELQAVQLLERASNQDYAPALLAFSELYSVGGVVKRDSKRAYQQTRRAAELGLKEAIRIEPLRIRDYCQSSDEACVTVPVLYVTDRRDSGDVRLDYRFANEREDRSSGSGLDESNLHYGVVTITVPADRETYSEQSNVWKQLLDHVWQYLTDSDPSDATAIRDIDTLSEEAFGRVISEFLRNCNSKRVMLFIHGFNNSFSFAVRRFAEFANRIEFDGIPIMYSWPSNNKKSGYLADLGQIEISCPRFTAALRKIGGHVGDNRIDVVAHSMGAKLLFDGLTAGHGGKCENPDLNFADVVLAAPDIDKALFLANVDMFRRRANAVTLYASSEDVALYALSNVALDEEPRLGQGGKHLTVHEDMDSLDASNVERDLPDDWPGHAYVFTNDVVIRDVHELVMLNRAPEARSCPVQHRRGQLTFWVFEENGGSWCRAE